MSRRAITLASKIHVALYRASGGRLGGHLAKTAPVLLLTTTGRKSGKQRTTPLLYVEEPGPHYVVIASVGGAPKHPAWYLNVRDNPGATIQIGRRRLTVSASTAAPEERTRLWALATHMYPGYDDYQAKTSREIPVVVLTPAA